MSYTPQELTAVLQKYNKYIHSYNDCYDDNTGNQCICDIGSTLNISIIKACQITWDSCYDINQQDNGYTISYTLYSYLLT